MSTRAESVRKIFDRAVALPHGERTRFLVSACADDASLRREVETLLTYDAERPEDYLDGLRISIGELEIGEVVGGKYKILERIGEGGVGIVYRAQQIEPVVREVALKVVKLGMDTKQVIARFEAERQALALMAHPGIAQVIDGGVTDSGRSYFVMELVKGIPITDYCDEYALSVRERLELFIDVCDAVRHAHQKGIIHRDLKPQNVLVTVRDGRPGPKIIDFGVAKATSQRLTEHTVFTAMHHFVGTPAYMSPEQAGINELDIDTRADIYSLGVLLFELLTGSTPVDATTMREVGFDEIRRMIRDVQPSRPSVMIARRTRDDPADSRLVPIARQRQTDPAALRRALRGDLDWIVMKALEKDRTRRYDAAGTFAEDIARHLRNEPVLAGPPSAAYRLTKFFRRNRVAVAVVAAFTILLVGFSIAMLLEARENRRLATSEGAAKIAAIEALSDADRERSRAEAALHVSNVAQGRLHARAGNAASAEDLLWREYLVDPTAAENLWALREFYAGHPWLRTTRAHEGAASAPAFSPDGRLVATGGRRGDHVVRIWDVDTLRCTAVLRGHAGDVPVVTFTPDGQQVASCSDDGTVRLWRATGGEAVRIIRLGAGRIRAISFAPDGSRFAVGASDARVRVYDAASGELDATLDGHKGGVNCVRFAPDGKTLASTNARGTVRILREDGTTAATLEGHTDAVVALAFTPDGRGLASGGTDRTIKVWDLATSRCRTTIPARNGTVRELHFRPDGRHLLASGWWSVDEWDVETAQRVQSAPMGEGLVGFALDTASRLIAVTLWDGRLRILEDGPASSRIRLRGHDTRTSAVFGPGGRQVATGDSAGVLRLWEATTGALVATLDAGVAVRGLRFHPSDDLLAAGGTDGTLRVWNLRTGEAVASFDGHGEATAQSVDFSPDGRLMASTRADGQVVVRNVDTWRTEASFRAATGAQLLAVRFSPDGRTLATTARSASVRLWTLGGEPCATFSALATPWAVAFSPDGRRLATGGWGQVVHVWEIATGAEIALLEGHSTVVWSVAFGPDGDLLASCSDKGTVRLWDVETGLNIATFDEFDGFRAITVAFDRDAYGVPRLLVGGGTGEALIRDLSYYDRHIVGNLDQQIARLQDELGDRVKRAELQVRRDEVLRRPWPRLQPVGVGTD